MLILAEANLRKIEKLGKCEYDVSRRDCSVDAINKTTKMEIRVTVEEKEKLQAMARMRGVSLSKMIMDLLSVVYL